MKLLFHLRVTPRFFSLFYSLATQQDTAMYPATSIAWRRGRCHQTKKNERGLRDRDTNKVFVAIFPNYGKKPFVFYSKSSQAFLPGDYTKDIDDTLNGMI